ncbi:MAG: 50S ribosomal protein L24 [Flavobacteriales bacterium]|nr:50S ribosomal protein L24 [Flavobacteriales bacterium]NNK80993.1 50S ribosomal protein L24 [Flavobacteriales bacterium]
MTKLHIKKGDQVRILTGIHRGEEGKILEVDPVKMRAIVEGKNLVTKHTRPNAAHPEGGIIKEEAGIHISNLMVIDSKSGEPSRVGRKKNDKGVSVRYFKKSGQEVK